MTTYAYDNWVQLPTRDLYDTQVMAMAINAARDMYEKGEQRIKDFNTAYGDFITPIQADQDWYNQNVTGKVRDTINNLYARGIDPLRSAEGRAIVAQLVNSIPVGDVAKLRSSAKAAEEYIKNRGLLEAAGKYNSDLEERFLGYDLANWDTINGKKIWNRTSPTEMKTLKELTESWYNNRTARDLTEADLKAAGIPYDRRYQYSGYLDSDILNVARGNTPGWNDSVYSRYYRDLAERQLAASGMPYTKQDVEARLQRNIADAQQEWLINPTKKVDEFVKMAQQAAYARQLEGIRAANDKEIAQIKANASGNKDANPRYSPTMNMVVDSEGALRGQLMNYANPKSTKVLDQEEADLVERYQDMIKNPSKYRESDIKYALTRINNASNRRISVGLEGVADEVVKLAKSGGTRHFTDNPEKINSILRDLSSQGATTTTQNLLRELGGIQDEDGGINISRRDRLCGVGEVMEDVLARGYTDGVKHPSIDKAIKELKSGDLSMYRKAWTTGSFDIRNWTDSGFWQWGGASKFWPTGNVVTGDKYYYIEVANDPTDHDECCWFRVERDKAKGGGINPVLSGITQEVDDSFLKKYSNSNVIGNQQSAVEEYNK